ncbi:ATP-binding protein [Streptomyces sp. NPDC004647]|uniref:ATP-binding protein n=1 Tax=Streptomyces sp. NPDC004647 TaxID=3154671 RepID=UPI0033B03296
MGTEGSTMLQPLRQGLPPIDPTTVSSSVACSLSPHYESVKDARQFAMAALGRWDLTEQFDSVALVVSELVTNALRHALPDGSATAAPEPLVRLHLMHWASRLVCAVRDPSDRGPVVGEVSPGDPDCTAESGRGLYLVETFSDSWGWHPLAGTLRGKVVWALFQLPTASWTVRSADSAPQ